MNNNKITNVLTFYMLANTLKDKIRQGWNDWHINRQRVESIAEHIYGTAILAIAIDSEFKFNIDIQKIITMITVHEIEEIEIGDITPFSNITKDEKRRLGKQAVEKILQPLSKKYDYINLIEEFELGQTEESKFAKMCDKLEADIQAKIYCEENSLDISLKENKPLLKDIRVQNLLSQGEKTIADLFIENDRKIYNTTFEEILDFIKSNNIT